MEMLLIILGGVLVTAIVFVLVDRPALTETDLPQQSEPDDVAFDDPLLTPELMARLRREFAQRHAVDQSH